MKADNTIPILVGVTGHRSIKKEDYNAIYTSVKAELGKLQDRCPNSHIVLLTSLAEGGDLLCAEAATELDIPLVAVLPDELEPSRDSSPRVAKREKKSSSGNVRTGLI